MASAHRADHEIVDLSPAANAPEVEGVGTYITNPEGGSLNFKEADATRLRRFIKHYRLGQQDAPCPPSDAECFRLKPVGKNCERSMLFG